MIGAVHLGLAMLAVDRERGVTVDIARHLEGLAATVGRSGAPGDAARLLGAAAALRDVAGVPPSNPTHHEGRVNVIPSALPLGVFAVGWTGGQTLTPEEAIIGLLGPARNGGAGRSER
ncbi:MAG: hypothetical protein ACR2JY_01365 [Chloroflexota bacterium]